MNDVEIVILADKILKAINTEIIDKYSDQNQQIK